MKILKRLGWGLVGLLVLLNVIILISGNTHLYKGIVNTYLKGRSGPDINEFPIFSNRTVQAGQYQPIPNSSQYNKTQIDTKSIESYSSVAYLVIRNDSVCYEHYWDGYGPDSLSNSFSMAKSFVGALVGCALQDGYIKSLDQPVTDFLPTFSAGNGHLLTIRHLLTMSSGINFDENYVSPFAYPAIAYYGNDITSLTLRYTLTEQPGKVFKYLSGNTELLGLILEKATGKKLSEYMSQRLWMPLGAKKSAKWSLDHENGMEKAYCCFNSNARDFARLGLLYLHGGNWKGKQLIPEDYIRSSIVPAPLVEENGKPNKSYGYQWWIIQYNGKNYPCCRGILGQYIILIPEKNMVVVRLGHRRSTERRDGNPVDIFLYLSTAIDHFSL